MQGWGQFCFHQKLSTPKGGVASRRVCDHEAMKWWTLIFFSFLLGVEKARKITKKQGSFILAQPVKSLGKMGTCSKKKQGIPSTWEKARKSPKSKEKKIGEVKAMKTMKMNRFIASPSSVLFFIIERRRTLPDPERVSDAHAQRTLSWSQLEGKALGP